MKIIGNATILLRLISTTAISCILALSIQVVDAQDVDIEESVNLNPLVQELRKSRTVDYLAELSKRRRLSSIFPNQQSPFYGVQIGYTNVSTGNLTFLSRDLVRLDRIPAVFGRVYDSRISENDDFGPGWRLAVEETIVRDGDQVTYVDSSNSTHNLQIDGNRIVSKHSHLTGIAHGKVRGNTIQINHTGMDKTFKRMGDKFVLTSVADTSGNELTLKYKDGKLTQIQTRSGRTITVVRNDSGRIKLARDDSGKEVVFEYDAAGLLSEFVGLGGGRWVYHYNSHNQLTKAIDPRGESELMTTFEADRVATITARGESYRFEYEGNETWVSNALYKTARITAHASGLTQASSGYTGATTRIEFDPKLRSASFSHEELTVLRWRYDNDSKVSRIIRNSKDGESVYKFGYENGRLAKVRQDDDVVSVFKYDDAGRVAKVRDASGERGYRYDEAGSLIGLSGSESKVRFERDSAGSIVGVFKDGSRLAKIDLDQGDRVESLSLFNDEGVWKSKYANRSDGLRENANYDVFDAGIEFDYDQVGNLTTIEYANGSGRRWRDSYVTGPGNRIDGVIGETAPDVSFEYDAAGLPVRMTQNDREALFVYDDVGRLESSEVDGEEMFSIDYDPVSRGAVVEADGRTSATRVNKPIVSLVFDSIDNIASNRLVGSPHGPVSFDSATARFVVDSVPYIAPDVNLLSGLHHRMLLTDDDAFDLLPLGFDKPSNSLFIPPEFYTVNCFICIDTVNDVTITVDNSTALSFKEVGENVVFDVDVSGICVKLGEGGPIGQIRHYFWYGDGAAQYKNKSGFNGDTSFTHSFSEDSVYVQVDSVTCTCNSPFSAEADSHIVYVDGASSSCTTAGRHSYHAAQFFKNNILDIVGSNGVVTGNIKVRPRPGASFSTFVDGASARWNKTFLGGELIFNFEEVGDLYFGNDAIQLETVAVNPNNPEQGFATVGGTDLTYAFGAAGNVMAHEFGHILGFRDAYELLPSGFGQDIPCHEDDIMGAAGQPADDVYIYHAALLVSEY